jgi:LysM repeat protein
MNNPNPFVPKGSLLEQQSLRRSRLKIAVGCALAVSVTGLVVMLIQGCKPEKPADTSGNTPSDTTNGSSMGSTSTSPTDLSSNSAVASPASNTTPMAAASPVPSTPPPMSTPTPAPAPTPAAVEPAAGAEYVVVSGDTLAKIAKANGVTLKAMEAANPGVDPRKLKPKQKLVLPGKSADASAVPAAGATVATESPAAAGATYTVKSGDNLSKIAKRHGLTLKALKAANNLTTDHIKVGQKLSIPAKTETAAAASAAPAAETPAAAVAPQVNTAPAASSPAPGTGR